MRMARVNVYLPDDLAQEARGAGINISNLTQRALRHELAALATDAWLKRVAALPRTRVSHEQVLKALDEAREEFGDWPPV
jgi:post-segregation antitoxin (ccd killing protein)